MDGWLFPPLFLRGEAHFAKMCIRDRVNADHIIARLREHQRQLTGAAAKVGKDAVVDAVLLELCMDVGLSLIHI